MSEQWQQISALDGIVCFRLRTWTDFFDFVEAEVFEAQSGFGNSYLWRGQRRSDWKLTTSLDRLYAQLNLLKAPPSALEQMSLKHLESFKYASRGRRGVNPALLPEDELWWALGQHFGLATPLLDWTSSPFAAAYFAFEDLASDPTEYRIVFGLNKALVDQKNKEFDEGPSFEAGSPFVEFVEPLTDENARLVSQGGCFTRAPIGTPIEDWVSGAFKNSTDATLLRIEIPDADRIACLRTLNRMNINHLSLFPDLTGASRYTNLKFELEPLIDQRAND